MPFAGHLFVLQLLSHFMWILWHLLHFPLQFYTVSRYKSVIVLFEFILHKVLFVTESKWSIYGFCLKDIIFFVVSILKNMFVTPSNLNSSLTVFYISWINRYSCVPCARPAKFSRLKLGSTRPSCFSCWNIYCFFAQTSESMRSWAAQVCCLPLIRSPVCSAQSESPLFFNSEAIPKC